MSVSILDDQRDPAAAREIHLPYNFRPREYQMEALQAAFPQHFGLPKKPAKRIVLPWHRRAGKDKLAINILTLYGMEEVGNYLYMSPEISQTRKIIWQGIDRDGFRFIDHVPNALIKRRTEADMLVELINGSTLQLGGADAYDRNMGTNPKAIVFSEFSLMNPIAWNYYRPILVENDGAAVFIFTARGHNHAYELYKTAKKKVEEGDPRWFLSLKTINDTKREDGSPVITQKDVQNEIDEGMPEEMVRQEFYCSFEAGLVGAYYAEQIGELRRSGRVGDYPHVPHLPVSTAWDLGLSDATSIWFFQNIEGQKRIIDYEEEAGIPLDEWIKIVNDKPYNYSRHLAPHDLKHREFSDGKTRIEVAAELGIFFEALERMPIQDGINAVRMFLKTCVFHEARCEQGLSALSNYTKVYDEKAQTFRDRPAHNWASHGADAFRTLAMGWYDDSPQFMETMETPAVLPAMGRDRGYWRQDGKDPRSVHAHWAPTPVHGDGRPNRGRGRVRSHWNWSRRR